MASRGEWALRPAAWLMAVLAWASQGMAAQDFFHGGVSAQTMARAGIYVPDANRVVDSLSLNPAGLAALTGVTADLLATGAMARGSFSNAANQDSAMRERPAVLPFGAIGTRFGKSRWSGGLGAVPDFLSSVNWHYADSPGAAGANYGSQSEKSEIVVYRGAGGISYASSTRFAIGATVGMVYNENTLIAPFIFQSNPSLKGLKTLLALHTRGLGWGGSFGVTGRPGARLALSAAYSSPFVVNSHGHATGNMGVQFQAAGIPFQPAFAYDARVRVKLPESVLVGGRWRASKGLGLSLEGDWAHFHDAFDQLPVSLSNGTNADINGFLKSSSIQDTVPLHWSDQYTGRFGVDYAVGERTVLGGGYVRRSSLVPNGTVTPLTGAILKNALSTGIQYGRAGLVLGAAYSINLDQTARVGTSELLAGEYSNSRLTVGTQAVVLTASFRLGDKKRP